MNDLDRIRALRAQGLTPKEIARSLGMRPAQVSELVRTMAATASVVPQAPVLVACLASPGFSTGLGFDGADGEWSRLDPAPGTGAGLISVLLVHEHRYDKLAMCGYLVDVFAMGVKNALGPKIVASHELGALVTNYFSIFDGDPTPIPFSLAQALVLGAVDYAHTLGFSPHPDFERARAALGVAAGPSPIVFGDRGKPHLIPGPPLLR